MIKKIIALILVLCLVFSLSINVFAAGGLIRWAATGLAALTVLNSSNSLTRVSNALTLANNAYYAGSALSDLFDTASINLNLTDKTGQNITYSISDFNNTSTVDLVKTVGNTNYLVPSSLSIELTNILGNNDIALSKLKSSSEFIQGYFQSPITYNGQDYVAFAYNLSSDSSINFYLYRSVVQSGTKTIFAKPDQFNVSYANFFTQQLIRNNQAEYLQALDNYSKQFADMVRDFGSDVEVEGDWITSYQGSVIISDLDSIVYNLQTIQAQNNLENSYLDSIYTNLAFINSYLGTITNQLQVLTTNQFNFFQSTEAKLLRIEQELTGLSLESGKLFPLTLESVGFIKAFIALIFGIFIAIFHFLGVFVAVAPDYLFFVPQGLMPFVMALPFLALFMVFLHWVRG